jgi:hypothetical protein
VFGHLKCLSNEVLDIFESLNTLAHSQAEVSEPLMVESDSPVFREEFSNVRDNTVFVTFCQLVHIVLVEPDETPKTLQDNFFMAHICNGINQTDGIESELNEMALSSIGV